MRDARSVLAALFLGVVLGLVAHAFAAEGKLLEPLHAALVEPLGRLYLRALLLPVLPLIFCALVVTLCELDVPSLKKLGKRTLAYTFCMSAFAAGLGLLLANLFRPGEGMRTGSLAPHVADGGAVAVAAPRPLADALVNVIPQNPLAPLVQGDVLGVVLVAVVFGLALARLPGEGPTALRASLRGLYALCLRVLGWVLLAAPLGIFFLTYSVMYRLGLAALRDLGGYLGVVGLGLGLQLFVVYALSVRVFGGLSPRVFFAAIRPALATAFATASSSAAFPVALEVAEQNLKLPPNVTRFVLSAGATLNQNGTALYEGVTILFLAQVYNVPLSPWQQLGVMGVSLAAGIGAVGVPGASAPALAAVASVFGIPAEGVGLVLGLDRVLDMCRTTVNVGGDLAAAVFVASEETPS